MIYGDLTPQMLFLINDQNICLSLIIIICFTLHNNYIHSQIQKEKRMIEIPHEHIRESIPIGYTFYGCYDIDRTTEGLYPSCDYVILTPSAVIGDGCLPMVARLG